MASRDGLGQYDLQDLSRESDTIFGQWTMLEPSTPHIGKGGGARRLGSNPCVPPVYRRPTLSDSRNDHPCFPQQDPAVTKDQVRLSVCLKSADSYEQRLGRDAHAPR
jgi:hypothetical protein